MHRGMLREPQSCGDRGNLEFIKTLNLVNTDVKGAAGQLGDETVFLGLRLLDSIGREARFPCEDMFLLLSQYHSAGRESS